MEWRRILLWARCYLLSFYVFIATFYYLETVVENIFFIIIFSSVMTFATWQTMFDITKEGLWND